MIRVRKMVAFAAVMVGFTLVAFGDQSDTFTCRLFSVDTDSNKLVIATGQLGSGNRGGNSSPAVYQVQCNTSTRIHWEGSTDRMSMQDLKDMNILRLNTALTILPCPTQEEETSKKFTATEIIVMKPKAPK